MGEAVRRKETSLGQGDDVTPSQSITRRELAASHRKMADCLRELASKYELLASEMLEEAQVVEREKPGLLCVQCNQPTKYDFELCSRCYVDSWKTNCSGKCLTIEHGLTRVLPCRLSRDHLGICVP